MTQKNTVKTLDIVPAIASYNEYIINENGLNLRLIYKTEKEDGYFDGVCRSQKVREEKNFLLGNCCIEKRRLHEKLQKAHNKHAKLLISCGGMVDKLARSITSRKMEGITQTG
jgi:hypothetical protein